jgi:hypothetical protein
VPALSYDIMAYVAQSVDASGSLGTDRRQRDQGRRGSPKPREPSFGIMKDTLYGLEQLSLRVGLGEERGAGFAPDVERGGVIPGREHHGYS